MSRKKDKIIINFNHETIHETGQSNVLYKVYKSKGKFYSQRGKKKINKDG